MFCKIYVRKIKSCKNAKNTTYKRLETTEHEANKFEPNLIGPGLISLVGYSVLLLKTLYQ